LRLLAIGLMKLDDDDETAMTQVKKPKRKKRKKMFCFYRATWHTRGKKE